METVPKLTPPQALLLRAAACRADGRVIPPPNLRRGARVKVLTALMQRGWIEPTDDGHALTDAGYAVAGRKRPALPEDLQPVETPDDLQLLESIPVRPGTKLAALVVAKRRSLADSSDSGRELPATPRQHWVAADGRVCGADVQTENPANLGLHPDGGEAPRSRPRMGTSPGRTPFAWGEAQMFSGSCIHAGMSRWPCSTRQTSTWSERST